MSKTNNKAKVNNNLQVIKMLQSLINNLNPTESGTKSLLKIISYGMDLLKDPHLNKHDFLAQLNKFALKTDLDFKTLLGQLQALDSKSFTTLAKIFKLLETSKAYNQQQEEKKKKEKAKNKAKTKPEKKKPEVREDKEKEKREEVSKPEIEENKTEQKLEVSSKPKRKRRTKLEMQEARRKQEQEKEKEKTLAQESPEIQIEVKDEPIVTPVTQVPASSTPTSTSSISPTSPAPSDFISALTDNEVPVDMQDDPLFALLMQNKK